MGVDVVVGYWEVESTSRSEDKGKELLKIRHIMKLKINGLC